MWQNAEIFSVKPDGEYSKHHADEIDNSCRKKQKQHRYINISLLDFKLSPFSECCTLSSG
jgi:hypothetical protein